MAAGCGDEDEEPSAGSKPAPAKTAPDPPPPTSTAETETDLNTKPVIEKPTGEPPTELVKEDVVEGEGREAKTGDSVSVQYVGVSHSSGQEFDASWDRGQPFAFELGAGRVIPGWDAGVPGMKVGGRRKLVIPPDQAYGERGAGGAIGPNETLVFVIDLLEAK